MRIEQLQVYRQNGITTLAEGALFETARKRRQEEVSQSCGLGNNLCISGVGGCADFDVVVMMAVVVAGGASGSLWFYLTCWFMR